MSQAQHQPVTDADLIAAHVAGDPEAFGLLFTRHRDRLWAVALRTMGNPEDAADGLQDGLIAAYRRADSFRGDAQVTTWLHRVIVNACLDRLRAAKVRRADALPEDLDEHVKRSGVGAVSTSDAGARDPADLSVASEQRSRVIEALNTLPADQRAALVLVDMEGYPVAEVAEMLDCAPGTIKSRCSRGRTRLAVLLADGMDGGGHAESEVPGNRSAPAAVPSTAPRGPPPASEAHGRPSRGPTPT